MTTNRPRLCFIGFGEAGVESIAAWDILFREDEGARLKQAGEKMGARLASSTADAVENLIPAGHQSLGTHLDVGHYAATPVGMDLRATAVVTRVEGRTVEFRVEAFDDKERVGDGRHTRVVVNVERFDARVQAKIQK